MHRAERRARTLLPTTLLVAGEAFGPRLPAERVVEAIARGLASGGRPRADLCPLPPRAQGGEPRGLLDAIGLDARLHLARAVVVAAERLSEGGLPGSAAFEIATRARQGGVPAYAVTRESELDSFDARVLDLQVVLRARSAAELEAAGRELAALA